MSILGQKIKQSRCSTIILFMNERFKLWANSVFLQVYKDTTCKFSIVEIVADGYSKIYLSAKEWGYYFLKLHWKCN